MTPSIYLNLEDDVARIVDRVKREKSDKVILVCPKRCFLFNDSINLRLLKKQTDLLKKEVFILTMDERGQMYAKEAGFQLRFLPKNPPARNMSDVHSAKLKSEAAGKSKEEAGGMNQITHAVREITSIAKFWGKNKAEPQLEKSARAGEDIGGKKHKSSLPDHAKAAKASVPKVSVTDTIFPSRFEQVHPARRKKVWHQWATTAIVAVSLVLILALVFVVLPKATVVIYPKSEPVTRDVEVSIGTGIRAADASRLVLPATKVSQVLKTDQKFQSQGKKEVGNKAAGLVQIYNFTRVPINLKAGTTVLTVGNKSYQLNADVSQLRATVYKNPRTKEIDEKSLAEPVEITAAEGGESSNLPEGTRMEISNQVFGSRPQFLFAKTTTSIDGGTSRFLSVVSDQDVAASKNALENLALQNLRSDLNKSGLVLADQSYILEDQQFATDKPTGTESPTFEANLQAGVTGLAFKADELKQLIFDRIGQTMSGGKTLLESGQPMTYTVKQLDLNNGLAVLSVHFEGKAVYNVDAGDLPAQLAGKTKNQVNEILNSKTEIDRIDVTLAPVWQKSFPWFANKIKIRVGDQVINN